MKRRDLISGAAALAAYSALPRDAEAASRKLAVVLAGGWAPFPGASAHFDFTRRKYFWAGSQHAESDFATFTSPVFGAPGSAEAGLVPSSSTSITLAWSALGLSAPFAMAAVFYPTSSPGSARGLVVADGGDSTTDLLSVQQGASTNVSGIVIASSVTQATLSGSAAIAPNGARAAAAASFATNSIIGSVNGAVNGMTTDTVATIPTVTTVRFGRKSGGSTQVLGSLRHVMFFAGAKTQAELDALTSALLAIK